MKLYDLALADDEVRISPYCWLVKFGLLHLGVAFETVPLGFTEKTNYPNPDYGKLPILVDGDQIVCESAAILAYAERRHPGNPLTATKSEQAAATFYNAWASAQLYPALLPVLMHKVCENARPEDQDYFRTTREERFGQSLESLAQQPGLEEQFDAAMATLAAPLQEHTFLGGRSPNLCDYVVASPLMWKRSVTGDALSPGTPGPVSAWMNRMLDAFGGYGRASKTVTG